MSPTLEEVRSLLDEGYARVPVKRELYADSFTTIEVMRALRAASNHVFLLESAEADQRWGRYSFLGYDPSMEITCLDGELMVRTGVGTGERHVERRQVDHPGAYLREVLAAHRSPQLEGFPPFCGGLVGYFAYDYLKYAEPTLRCAGLGHEDFLDVDLMLFDKLVVFDSYRQRVVLIASVGADVAGSGIAAAGGEEEKTVGLAAGDLVAGTVAGGAVSDSVGADLPGSGTAASGGEGKKTESAAGDVVAGPEVGAPVADPTATDPTAGGSVVSVPNPASDPIAESYAAAIRTLDEMEGLIRSGVRKEFEPLRLTRPLEPRHSRERFCEMVRVAQHHIHEGDIFQVVLSDPLTAPAEGSLFDAYRVLRCTNPSPYMFYFTSDDVEIAGASPETLARLTQGRLYTYPLAGTRPRGATREADEALEAELLADEKELAEHNMLVDLGRNDLGRIARVGSVEVERYLEVLRFSHVMHLGSTVAADIDERYDAVDAVDSILPAGTLSGAPKIRACQIIQELEGAKRGIYGGAIGYLDFAGNMDTCIGIRLAYKKNGEVCVQSGAGIVMDSVPEREFEECQNKARAVVAALTEAEGGIDR